MSQGEGGSLAMSEVAQVVLPPPVQALCLTAPLAFHE